MSLRDRISGLHRKWATLPPWAGSLAALVILATVTAILSDTFRTPENIFNVLRQWSFVGIIALGMTFVIILGGIDLSVGSLIAFSGGLGVLAMNTVINAPELIAAYDQALNAAAAKAPMVQFPCSGFRYGLAKLFSTMGLAGSEAGGVAVAFVLIVLAATLAGWLTGLLVTKGKLAPFIATLGGLAAYRSLSLAMADGGEYRSGSASMFKAIGTGGIPIPGTNVAPMAPQPVPLLIPWPVLVFVLLAILAHVLLTRTRYGRYVVSIGCNERAAVYSGVNVSRIKLLTYVLIGLLTGIAAILLSSRMNSVSSSGTGLYYELDVIAAVVIGGTRMSGGKGTIIGTVVGVLILGVVGNMLNLLQVSTYLQGLVKGLIIVGAVLLQRSSTEEE
ncbi:MAG: ABC transporter permease [Victivallales bacterium]|nr:ABC transporter permease [Victivallales bacterium]